MSNLKAIKRDNLTSGSNNKLRADGFIPAVLQIDIACFLPIPYKLVKLILKDLFSDIYVPNKWVILMK